MKPPGASAEHLNMNARDADHEEAAHALRTLKADSLPAAITEILRIACRGLAAHHVAFWRLTGDNCKLRLFAQSDAQGVLRVSNTGGTVKIIDIPGEVLADAGVKYWRHTRDAAFAPLAALLQFSRRTQSAATLSVRLFDQSLGLLSIEFPGCAPENGSADTLLLQLVAARIEAAYLMVPSASRLPGTGGTDSDHPLQQSHLALTDESLRNLFYFAPTAMLLTDPEKARPVTANQRALALFGLASQRANEISTLNLWDDPADREQFIAQALTNNGVRGYRARLCKSDGSRFWARLSATVLDYNGQPSLLASITDVSDTVAAEEILHRTQKTLTTLLETSPFPLVVTRLDTGVVRYCNRKAADMFETPLSGLLGHTAPEFYADPSDRRYFIDKLRSAGQVEGFVAKLKTLSGQPFWAMLSAKTLDLNGEPVFMVAFADVTKQKHKQEELENLAFRDGLTNAYNRRYLMEAVQIELARAERNVRPPALALLDIDHFKHVNDTRGHEAGDGVLREFVTLVQGMLRKSDILARYGGEEFAILFPETDAATAHAIVERIRTTVAAHYFFCSAGKIAVTFSAGIAAMTSNGDSLIVDADRALYEAKRAGRNRALLAGGILNSPAATDYHD